MKYRAEIDGLRALAVLPVIFFHAGFEFFNGGFVGVDIFFVISGYLITNILIEDIENQRFSLLYFYERRARRILPALFFLILLIIPVAWFLMLPNQMESFSNSLIAVSLFVSNIYFWQESGYFEPVSEGNPLLHTWSLAVEEQFYLMFPIFLLFIWKFGKNKAFWVLVIIAILSLLLSEWGWRNSSSANFYLAPTRVWELLAGSLSAFIVRKRGIIKNNTLSLTGFLAIIFSIFVYSENTPFPSLYSLIPVVGVVLIIVYGEKETYVSRFLSIKFFVSMGLISYSAYLWHQPLFAFTRIRLLAEPSNILLLFLSALSLLIAYFSWRFIEIPIRKSHFSRKKLLLLLVPCWIFILVFGAISIKPYKKLTEKQLEYLSWQDFNKTQEFIESWEVGKCYIENGRNIWSEFNHEECISINERKKNVILLGDSHSAQLAKPLRKINNINLTNISSGGCRPIFQKNINVNLNRHCLERNNYFFNTFLKKYEENVDVIILAARWQKNELDMMKKTFESLSKISPRIIIVGGSPWFSSKVPELLLNFKDGEVPIKYLDHKFVATDKEIIDILENNENFLSVKNFICPKNCNLLKDGKLLMLDSEHLTPAGASYFVNNFLKDKINQDEKIFIKK